MGAPFYLALTGLFLALTCVGAFLWGVIDLLKSNTFPDPNPSKLVGFFTALMGLLTLGFLGRALWALLP